MHPAARLPPSPLGVRRRAGEVRPGASRQERRRKQLQQRVRLVAAPLRRREGPPEVHDGPPPPRRGEPGCRGEGAPVCKRRGCRSTGGCVRVAPQGMLPLPRGAGRGALSTTQSSAIISSVSGGSWTRGRTRAPRTTCAPPRARWRRPPSRPSPWRCAQTVSTALARRAGRPNARGRGEDGRDPCALQPLARGSGGGGRRRSIRRRPGSSSARPACARRKRAGGCVLAPGRCRHASYSRTALRE